jgi:hypothetical protein
MKRVIEAIENTPADYITSCIAQRCGDSAQGSTYALDPDEMRAALLSEQWVQRDHPEVKAPCVAFVAPRWRGRVGVLPLDALNALVRLEDPKRTGYLSAVVHHTADLPCSISGDRETWLILGPHEGREVLYTFHPGEPVPPSRVSTSEIMPGEIMLASEARALGLTHAKTGSFGRVADGDETGAVIDYSGYVDGWPVTLRVSTSWNGARWYASVGNTYVADNGGRFDPVSSRLALMDAYAALRVHLARRAT